MSPILKARFHRIFLFSWLHRIRWQANSVEETQVVRLLERRMEERNHVGGYIYGLTRAVMSAKTAPRVVGYIHSEEVTFRLHGDQCIHCQVYGTCMREWSGMTPGLQVDRFEKFEKKNHMYGFLKFLQK